MKIAISLHLLAAVIWVGGMFFAYMALRPASAEILEPHQRLPLWRGTLARFFIWVWLAVIILPASGYWMIFTGLGGMAGAGPMVHIMQLLGIIMILLFLHVFFAPFRRLKQALANQDLATAGDKLAQIRRIVAINLVLGIVVVIVAAAGRY